jgi:tetratricopeptide (TPR) repeat protein
VQAQWQRLLNVEDELVPAAIQQVKKDLIYFKGQQGIEARNLAMQLTKKGSVTERRAFNLLALTLSSRYQRYLNKDSLRQSYVQFIKEATLSNNLFLAAEACFGLSVLAEVWLDFATSTYFGLKGRDLLLQTKKATAPQLYGLYTRLASIAFNTAQFRDCITYASLAMDYEDKKKSSDDLRNTLALGYRGLGLQDSALYWFQKALTIATTTQNNAGIGVIKGNMGQVYFALGNLKEAYSLLQQDVQLSMAEGDVPSAMNSMQFIARILAMENRPAQALASLHTCYGHLPIIKNIRYRHNIMEGAAVVYHLAGMHDSAWWAGKKQIALRDSMQASITSSRIGTVTMQLDYEESLQTLKELTLEKKIYEQRRNLLLGIMLLLGLMAILLVNKQRMKLKYTQQILLKEKQAAETEAKASLEQLGMVKENLLAKSRMIEELQQELNHNQMNEATLLYLESLRQSVILTDDDWLRYRDLFEKVHPGFITRLREKAADISLAEMRMAMLMRLQLDNKEMASILGISAESVTKSKRRLKARLLLEQNEDLETSILTV